MDKAIRCGESWTDEELVEQVLGGEGERFACLYQRYYQRMFRMAYGMTGNRSTAEDLTQEIFMRAFQKLGRFAGRSSFATWLYRLAVNRCLNFRSQFARQRSLQPLSEIPPASAGQDWGSSEAQVLRSEVQDQIRGAILSLKPKMRIVVVLRDLEGLSYDEISERLECPPGTVAARLSRARRLLARKLDHLREVI